MKNQVNERAHTSSLLTLKVALSILFFATLMRITVPMVIGHPPNFSPIDAIALFSGVYFYRRMTAFAVVLLSVWMGDLILNRLALGSWMLFYSGFYWQYGCYLLITLLGIALKNHVNSTYLLAASVTSSILFFALTNFGVWYGSALYPQTLDGLGACYIAAIAFFKNTLMSDLLFTGLFFGSFALAIKGFSFWQKKTCSHF